MRILKQGIITKVSGPVVIAKGMKEANMFDVVKVSDKNLLGEIIAMNGDNASIQVYLFIYQSLFIFIPAITLEYELLTGFSILFIPAFLSFSLGSDDINSIKISTATAVDNIGGTASPICL